MQVKKIAPIHERLDEVIQKRHEKVERIEQSVEEETRMREPESLNPKFEPEINMKSARIVGNRDFNEFLEDNKNW